TEPPRRTTNIVSRPSPSGSKPRAWPSALASRRPIGLSGTTVSKRRCCSVISPLPGTRAARGPLLDVLEQEHLRRLRLDVGVARFPFVVVQVHVGVVLDMGAERRVEVPEPV